MLDTIAMAKRLNGEYKTVFEKVEIYGIVHEGETENKDEKMMEIFDILLEAQNENKPIEKIVGKDLELFCKNFFEEKVVEEENEIKNIFTSLYSTMKWFCVWGIFEMILAISAGFNILNVKSDISGYLLIIIVGNILNCIIKKILSKIAFKNKKIKPILYNLTSFIMTFSILLIILNNIKHNVKVSIIWMPLISSVYIIIYSIYRYKKYGKITNINAEIEEFNKEQRAAYRESHNVKMLVKKFLKMKEKNYKKRKEELTFKQFCKQIKKEYKNKDIALIASYILAIIIPCIQPITEDFRGGLQFLAFWVTLTGIFWFFIYRFLIKSYRESSEETFKILEYCEKEGINIIEYEQKLKNRQ